MLYIMSLFKYTVSRPFKQTSDNNYIVKHEILSRTVLLDTRTGYINLYNLVNNNKSSNVTLYKYLSGEYFKSHYSKLTFYYTSVLRRALANNATSSKIPNLDGTGFMFDYKLIKDNTTDIPLVYRNDNPDLIYSTDTAKVEISENHIKANQYLYVHLDIAMDYLYKYDFSWWIEAIHTIREYISKQNLLSAAVQERNKIRNSVNNVDTHTCINTDKLNQIRSDINLMTDLYLGNGESKLIIDSMLEDIYQSRQVYLNRLTKYQSMLITLLEDINNYNINTNPPCVCAFSNNDVIAVRPANENLDKEDTIQNINNQADEADKCARTEFNMFVELKRRVTKSEIFNNSMESLISDVIQVNA